MLKPSAVLHKLADETRSAATDISMGLDEMHAYKPGMGASLRIM